MGRIIKTIRRDGDSFILDTGKSPKGFQGVVNIVWTGNPLREEAMSVDRLARLPGVDDVDDEWYDLLVEKGLMPGREVDAEETAIASTRRIEDERFADFECHLASGLDIVTSMAGSGWGLEKANGPSSSFEWPVGVYEWAGFCFGLILFFGIAAGLAWLF
jgi:hypothetical protein